MSITLRTINDITVKPINVGANIDPSLIKGGNMFPEIYSNIFICSKKKSGKSQLIANIIKKCVGRNTEVYFFVSTIYKDPLYKHLIEWLNKKGIVTESHSSLFEEKEDILKTILDESQIKDEEEEEQMPKPKLLIRTNEDSEKEQKMKKEKLLAPEMIFVFDDISRELRAPTIVALLKMNRHFRSKIIISSQYVHDLLPSSIQQMDYLILFKGHPEAKIEKLWTDADLSVSLPLFKQLYQNATKDKYNFLYVDTRNESFRKNLNREYIVSEKPENVHIDEEK